MVLAAQFPVVLDWTSLILGVIGTALGVVALVTLPQQFFGSPRLHLFFGSRDLIGGDSGDEEWRDLVVRINNLEPQARVLKFLKVRREPAEDVAATFRLMDKQTQEMCAGGDFIQLKPDGAEPATRVRITPMRSAQFVVARHSSHGDPHSFDGTGIQVELRPGVYECSVLVEYSGGEHRGTRDLVVRDTPDGLSWSE